MMQTEQRKNQVEEYYQIAPTIVALIDTMPDSEVRYRGLWQEYLMPCIKDIEMNQLESCKERYTNMMLELKQNYYCVLQ